MREILFRGQTRKYGEKVRMGDGQKLPGRWVYGGVLQGAGDHSIIYGSENVDDPSEGLDKWCVHSDTLGQFTGLTDKNGKRIFEGDMVVSYSLFGHQDGCGIVNWNNLFSAWEIGGKTMYGTSIAIYEVIGNIHDNPELPEE